MDKYSTVFSSLPMLISLCVVASFIVGLFIFRNLRKGKTKIVRENEDEPELENYTNGPMAVDKVDSSLVVSTNERGYLTNVFRVRNGRTELIELKLREPLGSGMEREPAVPFQGRYFAIETQDKDGHTIYLPYDPREDPVISNTTPQDCYDATHWDEEVDGVFGRTNDWHDKINLVIIGLAIILNFIVALVALGKIGGR